MKSGNLNFLESSGPIQACNGTALPFITHAKCLFVTLGIRQAMHMRHIAICELSGSTLFSHIISQIARSGKKVIGHEICALISSRTFV